MGLAILLLILSVAMNEVYGKVFHVSTQLNSPNSKELLEKGEPSIKKTLNLNETLNSNTTIVRSFKFLESDFLLAKRGLLAKNSKVKRKSHKLGKANVSHLLLNCSMGVLEERNYSIPHREITNLEGYQRIYDCWYAIEITPD